MTLEEIILRRLSGQHLLSRGEPLDTVKDLCGLQAQFLSHALHGLYIRSGSRDTRGMVKSWTLRGTMHIFAGDDLPLFLHSGRRHFLRPQDTMAGDERVSARRKAQFADIILNSVAQGADSREELKAVCGSAGMTEGEQEHLFDPWGGIIRALCEEGRLCHKVQEAKAYALCPPFEPMDEQAARLELARRYFTHFGPATLRDAAYFFHASQAQVKSWLKLLPVTEAVFNGKSYYYIDSGPVSGEIPHVLFLAGFDQLMLGYDKRDSLMLAGEHLREIFTLSGIVRPALLVDGAVAGRWQMKNGLLSVSLFKRANRKQVNEAAEGLWPDIRKLEFL